MEACDAIGCVQVNTLDMDTGVVEETVITEGVFPDSRDENDLGAFFGVLDDDNELVAEVKDQYEELLQTIQPLCEENFLTCDKRNSTKQFLEAYNPTSVSPENFIAKHRLILFFEEDELHIKLLDGGNLVTKDACVGRLSFDTVTRVRRITSEISPFINLLKESEKFFSCPGAFYEDELERRNIPIQSAQIKSFLIEKVEDRYLYRSRQCPMTLKGTVCHPCSQLKECVFFNPIKNPDIIHKAELNEDLLDGRDTDKEENHNYISKEDSCIKGESISSSTEHKLKPKFSIKKDISKTPTYKSLIIEALLNSATGKLRLENIVDYLEQKYPNLGSNQKKLENGIRCNLSIHKLFCRVGQPRSKQSYWVMDPVEYQKILDEEKQREEEAKSFIDKRCQVALKQWNNIQHQHRQNEVVWVDFMRNADELRTAERFLVTNGDTAKGDYNDPSSLQAHEQVQVTPRIKVESSIKNKGPNKRGYGRNLDELADRINQKAIENIKIKSESLDPEQSSDPRMVNMEVVDHHSAPDPFSQFGAQGFQYPGHHSQVTPHYLVSVPLVSGQIPETLIIPEAEIVKQEPSVPLTPMMCGQPQEAPTPRKAVIIDGKKYRLNIVNNN